MKQMAREQMNYDRLMDTGRRLRSKAGPEADREGGVGHTLTELQNNWDGAKQKASDRQVIEPCSNVCMFVLFPDCQSESKITITV